MAESKNVWKDKLNQLAPPDGDAAWGNMELLLDKHMPVNRSKFQRYILLAGLLLLLIVGVCNCPFVEKKQQGKIENKNAIDKTVTQKKSLDVYHSKSTATKQPHHQNETSTALKQSTDITKNIKYSQALTKPVVVSQKRNELYRGQLSQINLPQPTNDLSNASNGEEVKSGAYESPTEIITNTVSSVADTASRLLATTSDSVSLSRKEDGVAADTSLINEPSAKQESLKTKKPSLSFGIGVNQFVGIADQKTSAIVADGSFDGWKNYIPVLYIKYNISNKVYLSGEVNVNAPQYTNRELLFRKLTFSSSPGPPPTRTRLQENFYAKKLFYLAVPFGFNVSPAKNFFIGGGLQYAHLSSAAMIYESKISVNGRPDSAIALQNRSINKNFQSLNLKENEWRFFANTAVKISRFDMGARYARSFSSYTNATPAISKQYNSSLSLFVRYDLFTVNLK